MRNNLPVNQISKGQGSPFEFVIEPDTEIVQTDFGGQTSLKPRQIVWTLTSQAKSIQEFVIDRFNDLAKAGQPASQDFGPSKLLASLMGCRDHFRLPLLPPALMRLLTRKSFIGHIAADAAGNPALGRLTDGLVRAANRVSAKC